VGTPGAPSPALRPHSAAPAPPLTSSFAAVRASASRSPAAAASAAARAAAAPAAAAPAASARASAAAAAAPAAPARASARAAPAAAPQRASSAPAAAARQRSASAPAPSARARAPESSARRDAREDCGEAGVWRGGWGALAWRARARALGGKRVGPVASHAHTAAGARTRLRADR